MPESQAKKNADEYHRRLCRAIDFISANLTSNLSVADIAQAASFSSFHFQRLFHAIIGESVAGYVRRLRLESAARRLVHGQPQDVTGLAIELGFSSSQNFAKAFKKHFGVTPTQFRRDSAGLSAEAQTWDSPRETLAICEMTERDEVVPSAVVRSLQARRVVYRRHFGSYQDAGVQTAFDALQRWAETRGLHREDGYLGIPWDDAEITPNIKCRFDACLVVLDDEFFGRSVNTQSIPAGRYASIRTKISDNDFHRPWTLLMRDWMPHSGFQPADGPRFELYHSDGSRSAQGMWDIEVCLPVKVL